MRTISKAVLALGVAAAAMASSAAPSAAQYYYASPGLRVYVEPPYHHDRYDRERYRNSYAYAPNTWNGCPHGYTVQSGRCKPYRGY